MIKGKSPYPFQTIALALTFSPELPFLIREMRRLCDNHNAIAVFIHIGKKTSEKQRELSENLILNNFNDSNSRIYWEQGEVIPSLLRICKHEVADLILLGASEKDNFQGPTGRIAKGVATLAKCSVLIYASRTPAENFKNIVVEGGGHQKTELTIQTTVYFAEHSGSSRITLVENDESSVYSESYSGYSQKISGQVVSMLTVIPDKPAIPLHKVSLSTSHAEDITDYCFKHGADLLITRSTDHRLRIFDRISVEKSIEKFMDNMPCHLMVVHSRHTE